MKYSFVIPYFKRPSLSMTLLSFKHFYGNRKDYEVVLVEDKKNFEDGDAHAQLIEIINKHKESVSIKHFVSEFDNYACPCSMINYGADMAEGEFVIMTNPECAHVTDILSGFDEELAKNKNVYVVAACANGGVQTKVHDSFEGFTYAQSKWYQHSVHYNRCLNWCTVLSKENYIKVGGFNEEFDNGLGRADVQFAKMVRKAVPFVLRDDLICVHQAHSREHQFTAERRQLISNNHSCKIFRSRFKK